MGPIPSLSAFANPVATIEQLSTSASSLDGVPAELETSIRFSSACLTQAAGVLLRLPQEVIARAIVLFTRFYTGPEGGSYKEHNAKVWVHLGITPAQTIAADVLERTYPPQRHT